MYWIWAIMNPQCGIPSHPTHQNHLLQGYWCHKGGHGRIGCDSFPHLPHKETLADQILHPSKLNSSAPVKMVLGRRSFPTWVWETFQGRTVKHQVGSLCGKSKKPKKEISNAELSELVITLTSKQPTQTPIVLINKHCHGPFLCLYLYHALIIILQIHNWWTLFNLGTAYHLWTVQMPIISSCLCKGL